MSLKVHPAVKDLKSDFDKGKMDRREFIRFTTLLGLSATAAVQLVAPVEAAAFDFRKLFKIKSKAITNWKAGPGIKRGGKIRIAAPVHKVTHPAQLAWVSPTNQLRQVAEYLTYTDHNNVTRPYLLKNWETSKDLKTWTLNLRKGVKFNNGDDFTADDVIFTFNQWLDGSVGSSMKGIIEGYLNSSCIEKTSAHQVKLHLKQPEIAVPEHLFHFPGIVLNHRTFEGDFLKAPHGTGPYVIKEFVEGQRCLLTRRNDYWKKGADGDLLPYLDSVEFVDMGTEIEPIVSALRYGKIDMIDSSDLSGADAYDSLRGDPRVNIYPATTNQTRVMRMRVDMKPWWDNRVRQALKLCQHREKLLSLAHFGQGMAGQDIHVSPKHPEYYAIDTPRYNPTKAKHLLTQAGYPDGVDVNLAVGSGWKEIVRTAEIMKQDALPAGFRININTMSNSQYWEKWTEVDLGITSWAHRPGGTMALNLGYTGDAQGNPVPWNESRWVDKEFSHLLARANGTLDVEDRRKIFRKLETIQQERGSIANAFWINVWTIAAKRVEGVVSHPSLYLKADEMWVSS